MSQSDFLKLIEYYIVTTLWTHEILRRLANLGERRTFAELCGRLGLGGWFSG